MDIEGVFETVYQKNLLLEEIREIAVEAGIIDQSASPSEPETLALVGDIKVVIAGLRNSRQRAERLHRLADKIIADLETEGYKNWSGSLRAELNAIFEQKM